MAAGKRHDFRIKTMDRVLWRKAGADLPLRVVVIAPLGYRFRNGSRMLYRQPAYLICTDPGLPLEKLLQYYLWRWGIEVNFREEKTLIGTGDLLRLLRYETWAGALRPGTFYDFLNDEAPNTNAQKAPPDLPSVLFTAA